VHQATSIVRRGVLNLGTYATTASPSRRRSSTFPCRSTTSTSDPAGYVFEWDKTNGKIKAYDQKDPAAAGGADPARRSRERREPHHVVARFFAQGN
jgi:hypothetical protein